MFDLLRGGDERVAFLIEYLVTKGVVTKNASTWINRVGGSLGVKTDFFMKAENKLGVVGLMDSIDYESYQGILNENLFCKTCSGKVNIQNNSFTASFVCEKCGVLRDKEGVNIDYAKVQDTVNTRTAKTQV